MESAELHGAGDEPSGGTNSEGVERGQRGGGLGRGGRNVGEGAKCKLEWMDVFFVVFRGFGDGWEVAIAANRWELVRFGCTVVPLKPIDSVRTSRVLLFYFIVYVWLSVYRKPNQNFIEFRLVSPIFVRQNILIMVSACINLVLGTCGP